jgi:hypothetical protein
MPSKKIRVKHTLLLLVIFGLTAQVNAYSFPDPNVYYKNMPVFPHMLFTETISNWRRAETSRPYWASTRAEAELERRISENQISILLNNDILAYYGHPSSRNMGILGRHSIAEIDRMLTELATAYEAASGGKKIRKAFYIIYGTVWPEGEIGLLRDNQLLPYIEYGMANDILVFIDHQIGRYDPVASLRTILPWLSYPNVHLALDPEWRTTRPMRDFGHITGEELNNLQQVMQDYMIVNNIEGERMLVIHQFNASMLRNRNAVRTDYDRVRLIHCMDGIGTPAMKRDTYAYNAQAVNMPLKGFKLFYNLGIPGAGFDDPILSPRDVYGLNPRPYIIMYQ